MRLRLLIPALFSSFSLLAQTWAPDPSFGENGLASFSHAKGNERITRLVQLGNGQFVAAGYANRQTRDMMVFRMGSNGQLDAGFGTNGVAYTDFAKGADVLNALEVQPADGKIVVGGSTQISANPCGMARFLSNGSPDLSFGTNGKVLFKPYSSGSSGELNDVKVLPDGKLLACGTFLQASSYRTFVARFLQNGTIDSSFGQNGLLQVRFSTATGSHYSSRLVLNGTEGFFLFGNYYSTRFLLGIAKLKASGSPDSSFSGDGLLTHGFTTTGDNYTADIHLLSQGRILVTGYANASGVNYRGFSARFTAAGVLDNAYGTNGQATLASGTSFNGLYASALLPDESLVATGETFSQNLYRGTVFKVSPGGQLSNAFGTGGVAFFSSTPAEAFGNAIAASNAGVWAAGGELVPEGNSYKSVIVGLSPAGQPQAGFGTAGRVYQTTTQPSTIGRKLHLGADAYWVSGGVDNLSEDQFVAQINLSGQAGNQLGGTGVSVVDFGSADELTDHLISPSGDGLQLANTGQVSLTFTGLGTFSGTPDYSLTKITQSGGIESGTQKKFRFASTHFTKATRIRTDPQGRIAVLAFQVAPTQSAGFIQRHKASNLNPDSSFGTNGKRSLYGLSFPNTLQAVDFWVDSDGNYLVLTQLSSGTQQGFRLSKTNDAFQAVNTFGNGSIIPGTFERLEPIAQGLQASRLFRLNTGYAILGRRGSINFLIQIPESGASFIEIPLPEYSSVSKVFQTTGTDYYLAGVNQDGRIQVVHINGNGTIDQAFNGGTGRIILQNLNTPTQFRDGGIDSQDRMVFLAGNPQPDGSGERLSLVRISQITAVQESQADLFSKGFLYPNPGTGLIHWSSGENKPYEAQIFRTDGKAMAQAQRLKAGEAIDVSTLPSGLYWFRLSSQNRSETLRFVRP